MNNRLSKRIKRLEASPIREILSVINRPGMVSFAGGLPATSHLPDFSGDITRESLQYGPSEGELELREHVVGNLKARGLEVDADRVIILSGSQQGIDLVAKLVIDQGTPVAVESPTYLAALQVFSLFGARYLPYNVDTLEDAFIEMSPKLLYANPTFRNPDSVVYSTFQRQKLASACDDSDTIFFEDDPYHDLVYEHCDRTPVCAYLKKAQWIYQSSFSKTTAPGLRLGYMACSPELHTPLLRLKQAADLHSSRISQQLLLQLLNDETSDIRLNALRVNYRDRRNAFDTLLHEHLGDLANWTRPAGGLFFWLQLKSDTPIDTRTLLAEALSAGVAFMPGEPFFADRRQFSNSLRLNFSHADALDADRALSTLADILVRNAAVRKCKP